MVYLPQAVFKHILSFKDPRYERVMNGDPYMATPTRVFVVERKEWLRYKHDGAPWVERIQRKVTDFAFGFGVYYEYTEVRFSVMSINEVDRELWLDPLWGVRGIADLEYKLHPRRRDPDAAIKCSYKATEMSMQCEACGPDLELYQRR